jgi:signal transduction histidine kinase
MQHFQVARLAAPAAVMLLQLQSLGSQNPVPIPVTLFKNPALLLHALDALHRTAPFPAGTSLPARLQRLDQEWLDSLIRRSALHVALQDGASSHAFLLRHWHLARLLSLTAAGLAQASGYADIDNAACCGLLLRTGMLVMEQQNKAAYAVLTANAWVQHAQLAAERELFQIDHIDTGTRLLESWQLDQFSLDAVRYQTHPLEEIRDAAPLVKICWYANALVEETTPELLRAGPALLGVTAEQIRAVLARAQQELDNECAVLGLANFPRAGNGDLLHEARQQLQQLRQEISLDNMLAHHAGTNGGGEVPLQTQLARVLQDAGIEPCFIVLRSGANQTMEVCASYRVQPEPLGISFICEAGRNALSALILQGGPGVLTPEPGLTVIDRQLLALLGGQMLLCETMRDGNKTSALLLGVQPAAVSTYLAQHALRRFIGRLLLSATHDGAEQATGSTLLLQQRVREAVHEANNPLSIIKNYLYLLGMKQGGGTIPEEFQLIRTEIDRVAAILSDLRKPESAPSAPRDLSLNKLVTGMYRLFADSFQAEGRGIKVELQLAADDPQVFASESALKQILTNLVKNAAEALGGNGALSAEKALSGEKVITLATQRRIYMHDRFFAQISIRDNGPGIAPDLMTRLFKPGTSTKGLAHGSGLDIVRRLVEETGGQIGCRSDSNGTAMDILLPLSE